jgi:transposase
VASLARVPRREWPDDGAAHAAHLEPAGETPLLHHCGGTHRKVSAIGALCVPPPYRSDVRLHPNANINAERVVDFLRQLLAQVDAPLVLIWDRLNAHRAYLVQDFLAAHQQLATEFFPPYAPDLNPIEYVWSYLKLNPLANRTSSFLGTDVSIWRGNCRHSWWRCRRLHCVSTCPEAMSSATNRVVVPCRT